MENHHNKWLVFCPTKFLADVQNIYFINQTVWCGRFDKKCHPSIKKKKKHWQIHHWDPWGRDSTNFYFPTRVCIDCTVTGFSAAKKQHKGIILMVLSCAAPWRSFLAKTQLTFLLFESYIPLTLDLLWPWKRKKQRVMDKQKLLDARDLPWLRPRRS